MASNRLTLALAQLNPTVGDVAGNAAKVRAARAEAARLGADVVMFPELFLAGCPPEDLVLRPAFQDACRRACEDLARETGDGGPAVLIGLPWLEDGRLYNAFALLDGGAVAAIRFQAERPEDGVPGGMRAFAKGPLPGPVQVRGVRLGLAVGADLRSDEVVECLAETGAELLLAGYAAPFRRGQADERLNVAAARVTESGLPLIVLNPSGGAGEAVFDGASFALNADASLACRLPAFRETVVATTWERGPDGWRCVEAPKAVIEEGDEADYAACVTGLRDYVEKNRFSGVVLELSGGLDAALCAAMAVDALGAERVRGLVLPARDASQGSLDDAASCAGALGLRHDVLPIGPVVEGIEAALRPLRPPGDGAGETLEGRARGTILTAASNRSGALAVVAGNRSALAVGSAGLAEAVSGGFNPIKDLSGTEVRRLAALRNRWKPSWALGPEGMAIPPSILDGAPRRTRDGLPPDDALDAILEGLVERGMRVAELVAEGHDPETVAKVEGLMAQAEHGRRQAAPGVRLASAGRERRFPLVNRFRDPGAPAHRPDETLTRAVGAPRSDALDF